MKASICHNCGEKGHYARDYRATKKPADTGRPSGKGGKTGSRGKGGQRRNHQLELEDGEEQAAEEEIVETPVNAEETVEVSSESVADDAVAKDAPYELENKE